MPLAPHATPDPRTLTNSVSDQSRRYRDDAHGRRQCTRQRPSHIVDRGFRGTVHDVAAHGGPRSVIEEILTTTPPPGCVLALSSGSRRAARQNCRAHWSSIYRQSVRKSSRPSRSACRTKRVVPAQFTSTSQSVVALLDLRRQRSQCNAVGHRSARRRMRGTGRSDGRQAAYAAAAELR